MNENDGEKIFVGRRRRLARRIAQRAREPHVSSDPTSAGTTYVKLMRHFTGQLAIDLIDSIDSRDLLTMRDSEFYKAISGLLPSLLTRIYYLASQHLTFTVS